MKHKVSELQGALLDAAVALAEGWKFEHDECAGARVWMAPFQSPQGDGYTAELVPLKWSTDWNLGGPLIERERIEVGPSERDDMRWFACLPKSPRDFNVGAWGQTALAAAMRAYVASKFGDEVELP